MKNWTVQNVIISGNHPTLMVEDTNTFTSYLFARGDQTLIQGTHDRNITAYVPINYGIWGKPGDTIYIRAYPIFSNAIYLDPHKNQYTCSGYNHTGSNILSVVR